MIFKVNESAFGGHLERNKRWNVTDLQTRAALISGYVSFHDFLEKTMVCIASACNETFLAMWKDPFLNDAFEER